MERKRKEDVKEEFGQRKKRERKERKREGRVVPVAFSWFTVNHSER